MNINRNEISNNIFDILKEQVSSIEREEKFDKKKCYLNYSSEDKIKLTNITGEIVIDNIPNDFFLFYTRKDTNECYFLCWGQEVFSDEVIEKEDATLADLCLLCYENYLFVSEDISKTEIYNKLFYYEDPQYEGYTFDDLKSMFKSFSLYKLNANSILSDQGGYCIYAYWLLCKARVSSFPWEEDTLNEIEKVITSNNFSVPYYNIALSLSTRQWTHVFLESYRIIEHVFPAIYLKEVGEKLKTPCKDIAQVFEETLNWRPPEEETLKKIFGLLQNQDSFEIILKTLEQIKNKHKADKDMNIYKWYYKKIRNEVAHFRVIHKNVEFDNNEWNTIIKFNFMTINLLYEKYKEEIGN